MCRRLASRKPLRCGRFVRWACGSTGAGMGVTGRRPGGRWPAHHSAIVGVMLSAAVLNKTTLHEALRTARLGYVGAVLVVLLSAFTAFHRTVTIDTFVPVLGASGRTDAQQAGVDDDAGDVPSQWCRICRQAKPVRAKHCLACKRCVLRFDHHCPYFGCCIGERNHGYFLVAVLLHCALAVYCGVLLLELSPEKVMAPPQRPEAPFLLLLFVIAMMLSFVGTFGFGVMTLVHWGVLLSGATSYEYLRPKRLPYLSGADGNPFDEGPVGNLRSCWAASLAGAEPRDWGAMLPPSAAEDAEGRTDVDAGSVS